MESTLSYIAGLLSFIAGFVVFGVVSDSLSSSQEVFVYPVICEGKGNSWQCSKSIHSLGRTGYKVYPDQQRVVYWNEEDNDGPLPLSDCVVRNKENWSCKYADGSGTVKMIDGDFETSPPESNITYIGRCRYWLIRLVGKMGGQVNFQAFH